MPCVSDYQPTPSPKMDTLAENQTLKTMLKEMQVQLNEATRAACTAMTAIEEWNYRDNVDVLGQCLNLTTPDIRQTEEWFRFHKEADQRRKDALIQNAIEKLTSEEIEALGLTRHGKTS